MCSESITVIHKNNSALQMLEGKMARVCEIILLVINLLTGFKFTIAVFGSCGSFFREYIRIAN